MLGEEMQSALNFIPKVVRGIEISSQIFMKLGLCTGSFWVPVKRNCNAAAYKYILVNNVLLTLCPHQVHSHSEEEYFPVTNGLREPRFVLYNCRVQV